MSKKIIYTILGLILVAVVVLVILNSFNMLPKKSYTAQDFGIQVIKSDIDYDNDGIDDYTDILEGAKKEAQNHPDYVSKYYAGGYPPDSEGVCTDVIWRALENAGYNFKKMVDDDIQKNLKLYTAITKPDPNIDFRRVRNLKIFFDNNTLVLTNDINKISEWMPGDIVILGTTHIGMISDKRNKEGIPYMIHNAGQPNRDEDALKYWNKSRGITGHYRFILVPK